MQADHRLDDRTSFKQPKPPMETGECPECKGPAEVVEFWSMSPDTPGVRTLKRQWLCASRPKRGGRFGKIKLETSCKVTTVEVREESVSSSATQLPEGDESCTEQAPAGANAAGNQPKARTLAQGRFAWTRC